MVFGANKIFFYMLFFLAFSVKPVLTSISTTSDFHYNTLIASIVIFISLLFPFVGKKIYLLKPMLLFIIFITIKVVFSEDISISIPYYFKYLTFASVFYLIYLWGKNNEPDFLLKLIVFSSLIPVLYGFIQILTGDYFNFYSSYKQMDIAQQAINSFFVHPNDFGVFLVASVAIQLSFFINSKLTYNKSDWLILLSLVFFVFQSQARVALVGMVIVFVVFFVVVLKPTQKVKIIFFSIIVFFLLVIYFVFFNVHDESPGKGLNSLWWRIDVWIMLIQHVDGFSILVGKGLGYSKELLSSAKYIYLGVANPHSEYIRIFLELGALGVILYIYTLSHGIKRAYRVILNRKIYSERLVQLSVILVSLNVSALIMSITENILFNLSFQWVLWSVNALFFVVRTKEKQNIFRNY